jgi:hypothetical protein
MVSDAMVLSRNPFQYILKFVFIAPPNSFDIRKPTRRARERRSKICTIRFSSNKQPHQIAFDKPSRN